MKHGSMHLIVRCVPISFETQELKTVKALNGLLSPDELRTDRVPAIGSVPDLLGSNHLGTISSFPSSIVLSPVACQGIFGT